ncbi:MAG: hypothetical protein M3007_02060, partial [Candidatus Eremiobacteraeota bacterium]|nr:hypothetical protein [Candidatus Eremiobacteraeota bacterium]
MQRHRLVSIFWAMLSVSLIVFAGTGQSVAAPSQQQVDQTRQFMEFVFGFKLDPPLVQSIQDGLAADLKTNEAGALSTLNDMRTVMHWVQSQPAAGGKLLRSYIEPELVASFRNDSSDSSGTSKALVAAWRSHNQIIADGRPPLRRDVVQA